MRVPAAAALALAIAASAWLMWPARQPAPVALPEAIAPQLSAAEAFEKIRPSVVHVRGIPEVDDPENDTRPEGSVGTGVVIVDNGIILTNLHVVAGAEDGRR